MAANDNIFSSLECGPHFKDEYIEVLTSNFPSPYRLELSSTDNVLAITLIS